MSSIDDKNKELCELLGWKVWRGSLPQFYTDASLIAELMKEMRKRNLDGRLGWDGDDCESNFYGANIYREVKAHQSYLENIGEAEDTTPQAALAEACRKALKDTK